MAQQRTRYYSRRKCALLNIIRVLFPAVTRVLTRIQWHISYLIQLVYQRPPSTMARDVDLQQGIVYKFHP